MLKSPSEPPEGISCATCTVKTCWCREPDGIIDHLRHYLTLRNVLGWIVFPFVWVGNKILSMIR